MVVHAKYNPVLDPVEVGKQIDEWIPFRARTGHEHATWARTFRCYPEFYIQPETVAEVVKIVQLARQCRRRIVVVGSGHSPSDLTMSTSWVVNLDRMSRVVEVDRERRTMTVEGGMRLHALSEAARREGLALPSLGSIDEQSIAGAISTGTHGSSASHGMLNECVFALELVLGTGEVKTVTAPAAQTAGAAATGDGPHDDGQEVEEVVAGGDGRDDTDLWRAAILGLGCIGIITKVSLVLVDRRRLRWHQVIDVDDDMFRSWSLAWWRQAEFFRVWWFPYAGRYVKWMADAVPPEDPDARAPDDEWARKKAYGQKTFQDSRVGRFAYKTALFVSAVFPSLTPRVERLFCRMQYGGVNGESSLLTGVDDSSEALLMNCLYSQFVNEWALELGRAHEALLRLRSWMLRLGPEDDGYMRPGIPFEARDIYCHVPIEIRIVDTSDHDRFPPNSRAFLDPTHPSRPTIFINCTFYRPFGRDPPFVRDFYHAFEYLMRELGGKPHWAKNFQTSGIDIEMLYGTNLRRFRRVRARTDPHGIFVGPWHRRTCLERWERLENEEIEVNRWYPIRGGVEVVGAV